MDYSRDIEPYISVRIGSDTLSRNVLQYGRTPEMINEILREHVYPHITHPTYDNSELDVTGSTDKIAKFELKLASARRAELYVVEGTISQEYMREELGGDVVHITSSVRVACGNPADPILTLKLRMVIGILEETFKTKENLINSTCIVA